MSASVDSQAYYKIRLDKFKSRSNRIFNRAQNLNRTLDRQLESSVKSLATNRDVNIRRDQEKIWMVTGAGLHPPKYSSAKEDVPSYLQKQAHATLPTPQELSSLLPNKKAKERTQSAGNYMQLSKRRLSSMKSMDLNIIHYRKALESMREKEILPLYEIIQENEGSDDVDGSGGDVGVGGGEQREASPNGSLSVNTPYIRPNTAIPSSSSSRPSQPERPKTSIPDAARRKRRESVPNATALMIEQAQDPKNKVLRTNFLDMYKTQMAKHQRRMSAIKDKRSPKATAITEDPSERPRTAGPTIAEEDEEDERGQSPGFMSGTSASNRRKSLRQRLRRTSLAAVSGMNTLHKEVKSFQSFRKFKKESLNVLENDIPSIDDLEEGELFDEMRKCRYIRWGEDEEMVEKLNEDQPLTNHLKRLSIDTTKRPKRFLKKLNEQHEPGS
nr:uncharacterized protein LOC129281271 [Lytechinus pictus]